MSRAVNSCADGRRPRTLNRVAYDEELAARIRDLIIEIGPPVPPTEKKMFGGLAFLIGGNMSVSVSGRGGIMVRMDPEAADALLDPPAVDLTVMRGRRMAGWVSVAADTVIDDRELRAWVERGLDFAAALPPKPGT